MNLKFYNTLTRKKEDFVPLSPDAVTMYSCGPTVYSYAHIGNMRAYIFMDSVRRVLRLNGFALRGMMNITDVGHLVSDGDDGEDKLEKAGREQQLSPYKIAENVTEVFFKDLEKLNISRPEIVEKATDHIDEMLEFVYALLEKGAAYVTSDGVYFDIAQFDGYGRLSGQKLDENIAGARVEVNTEKRSPADFALWKNAPKEHIMQWKSRFGMGFPGWHIECSALQKAFFGDCFDIHTGGVDHIPVHHENEIAQSQSLTGVCPAKVWMHGEFMQVDGGKMSKSLGNTYTLSELENRGFSPMAFRYFCLNTHYRKKLNFTFEGLSGAKTAYERLIALLLEHKNSDFATDNAVLDGFRAEFLASVNDDTNIPMALGVLWTMLKLPSSFAIYQLALEFDKVFGLRLEQAVAELESESQKTTVLPPQIEALLEQRAAARAAKNFAKSDEIRDKISTLGYTVKDTKEGQKIEKN